MNTTTAPKAQTPATAKKAPAAPVTRSIKLLVPNNPKKPGSASAARFALYKDGMTVASDQEAVKAAGQPMRLASADLLWDVRHKFIELA